MEQLVEQLGGQRGQEFHCLEHRIAIDKKANPAGYGRLMQDIYNYHSPQKSLVMFANW